MKTKGFRKALALLLAFLMLSATFTMFAYADEPALDSFTTDNGASVRIGTAAGIRFKTTIRKTQFDDVEANIEEIGTLIAPAAFITDGTELTTELDEAMYVKVVANKAHPFADDGTTVTFAGSLENIKEANYMREYVARGYVVISGTTYYAEMSDARTVGYTSYKAYLDQSADNPIKDNLAAKALIAPFANAYLVKKLGSGAPTIDRVRYYEDFNDADTYSNGVMTPSTLANDSAAVAQRYGITVTSADDNMTPSFWIDNGRLMISTFTGITGDTRGKDTAGGFAFFTLDALKNSQLQSQIYSNKFTVQYDIAYSCRAAVAGETALAYDTANWASNFITLMHMDGTSGTACGLAAGGHVRLEYFTDKVGAILTEENMFAREAALGKRLRESDVGIMTIKIQVDPEANTIKLYGKTSTMTQFELLAETSATSAGYAAMSAATSKLIGFGIQYGNNAMLDNLLIYSGHGDAPDTSNYTPAN